jgi:hypothetical protein
MSLRRTLPVLALFAALAPLAAACGPVNDGGKLQEDPPPPPPAKDAGGMIVDAEPPAWCKDAQGIYSAKPEVGNLLIVLDRSGSMHIKLSDGTSTRWTATKAGLFDMLNGLGMQTRVGAMMFPQGDAPITCCFISPTINDVKCNCATGELPGTTNRCAVPTYKVPVPMADATPQQIADIKAYVSSSDKEFYWGTPLTTAIQSAIAAQKASKLSGPKSVLLFTDGIPTSCDTPQDPNANDIQRAIDAAAQGEKDGIRTFVMGVIDGTKGARASYLSPIAKAGGTARAMGCEATNDCFYPINAQTFTKDVKAALDQIALQAFDCTFEVPAPAMGSKNDISKVNVQLRTQNGTVPVLRDVSKQNGWDYLPQQTHIQLYGQACKDLKADVSTQVEIIVGCQTMGM